MATKTRTKTTDQPLYLAVSEERGNGYFHLRVRVRGQQYDQSAHQHVPVYVDDDYSAGFKYSGLQLTAQGDERTQRATDRQSAVYGWSIEYHDVFRLDLQQVTRMQKTLATIDKRLEKLREQRGEPGNFGTLVGRLAEALGCEGIACERTSRQQQVSGYRWDWGSIGEGVDSVNRMVWRWQQEAVEAERQRLEAEQPRQLPAATVDGDVVEEAR